MKNRAHIAKSSALTNMLHALVRASSGLSSRVSVLPCTCRAFLHRLETAAVIKVPEGQKWAEVDNLRNDKKGKEKFSGIAVQGRAKEIWKRLWRLKERRNPKSMLPQQYNLGRERCI